MKKQNKLRVFSVWLFLSFILIGCGSSDEATNIEEPEKKSTFVMIHFEAGYQGRLNNDLPINIPNEYMTMDFGWQEYLFGTAQKLYQYPLKYK